VNMDAVLKVRE